MKSTIARTWHGRVPLIHADSFYQHLLATGAADYERTEGCLEMKLLRRDSGGYAHFLLLSFWSSYEAIRRYAGDEIDRAVLYPGDERFELEPDLHVEHYDVL